MKKLSTLMLSLLAAVAVYGQFTVQVTSPGVAKLTYGASNDYSIYNPGFEVPTFWVHVWSNAADNSTGTTYNDVWSNSNVTMNWDATAMAYVGTLNLNTKVFTDGNRVFPTGTTVSNLGFVFKNQQNGASNQSGDLVASNFGFTPTTLTSLGLSDTAGARKSYVSNGKLYTSEKGQVSVAVYEMSGKLLKTITVAQNNGVIDLSIPKSGLYLAKISGPNGTEVVKFAK